MSATNAARENKRENICVGNNVSATMCPRLLGPLKHFEISVSQLKKSKCLGFAKKNVCLAVSRSLAFDSHHPSGKIHFACSLTLPV